MVVDLDMEFFYWDNEAHRIVHGMNMIKFVNSYDF